MSTGTGISALYQEFTDALTEVLLANQRTPPVTIIPRSLAYGADMTKIIRKAPPGSGYEAQVSISTRIKMASGQCARAISATVRSDFGLPDGLPLWPF